MNIEQDAAHDAEQPPLLPEASQPFPPANNLISDLPRTNRKTTPNQPATSSRILTAFFALVIIIGSICLSISVINHNIQQSNLNATATAQVQATGIALSNRATATKEAKGTATAVSNITATAAMQYLETVTAVAPDTHDPYPPNTGYLAYINDLLGTTTNLPNDDKCTPSQFGYRISAASEHSQYCPAWNAVGNFTMEVTMKIEQGNCGGLQFRANPDNTNFYLFQVCADSSFEIYVYDSINAKGFRLLKFSASDAILFGHSQKNTIAVVAIDAQLDFYVNHKLVDHENDASFSNGYVGLFATSYHDATVVTYAYERIWNI